MNNKKLVFLILCSIVLSGCGNSTVESVKSTPWTVDGSFTTDQALSNRPICVSTEWKVFEDARGRMVVEYQCELTGEGEYYQTIFKKWFDKYGSYEERVAKTKGRLEEKIKDKANYIKSSEQYLEQKLVELSEWSKPSEEKLSHLQSRLSSIREDSLPKIHRPGLNEETIDRISGSVERLRITPMFLANLPNVDIEQISIRRDDQAVYTIANSLVAQLDYDFSQDKYGTEKRVARNFIQQWIWHSVAMQKSKIEMDREVARVKNSINKDKDELRELKETLPDRLAKEGEVIRNYIEIHRGLYDITKVSEIYQWSVSEDNLTRLIFSGVVKELYDGSVRQEVYYKPNKAMVDVLNENLLSYKDIVRRNPTHKL
ncbi:hypothetical protein [Endozoicomonas numazuensis]|uniref:hypothetical protein n=1 Tax=Endozoicomonas numazuensis TaxID=1137799 RepID=UPI0012684065|nr:hypothetical protein [Endozoicomonas numazuensis]